MVVVEVDLDTGSRHTRQLLLHVLKELVAVLVDANEGTSLGITNILDAEKRESRR